MSEVIYIMDNGEKRKATPEELAQLQKDIAEAEKVEALKLAEKQSKEAARESALAKLAALGLTEAEIAAL
jgi:hypothetical protein